MTLTFGSLFAGIGGMDLGLERAGFVCRWQVEIDPFCQRVLAKHWPHVSRFADVREVGAHNLERVDLICGGFPCQDISNAGKRAGLAGERSGLWSEYARIIRELRPRFVLVENVAALLARGLGRVLGDLAESGFDAEWSVFPACAVGAPHERERLFLVAHADCLNGRPWMGLQSEHHGHREIQRCGDREGRRLWLEAEPDHRRVVDGNASGMDRDRLRGLGNAVVPQVAEFIGRRILEARP